MIEGLGAIVRFLPDLEKPDFRAGKVCGGEPIEPGVFSAPFVEHSAVVDAFVEAAYQNGVILQDFDWPEWGQSAEAEALRRDDGQLSQATLEQLRKLLTVCVRSDRFVEGALLDAFESGLILKIVRRAVVLTNQTTGS